MRKREEIFQSHSGRFTCGVFACRLWRPGEKRIKKIQLTVAIAADPPTLDPHAASIDSAVNNLNPVYETLVKYDDDGEIVPCLATEWERIDDLRWRFKLRNDVKFHNGEKMTANDVF